MRMGYGDAYVYCLVISPDVVSKIQRILYKIEQKQQEINEILADMDVHPEQNKVRGERGLKLMDEQRKLRWQIIVLCKNPIAIHHIASDDWLDAWTTCSRFNFVPMKVSEVIKRAHGKMWCDESLKAYKDNMCICIPSHYDTDTELMMEICGCEWHKEYMEKKYGKS